MEVMKDVSILFHRDKCFFFGCQVSIPLSFKLIGTYHNIRCIGLWFKTSKHMKFQRYKFCGFYFQEKI